MENDKKNLLQELQRNIEDYKRMNTEWTCAKTTEFIKRAYKKGESKSEILELYKVLEDKQTADSYGQTPLHLAAKFADFEAVEYLLSQGLKANVKDRLDRTPLHYLAVCSEETQQPAEDIKQTAFVLLDAKVSALLRDGNRSDTCYHLAMKEYPNFDLIYALMERKTKLDMADKENRNLLHLIACYPGRDAKRSLKYARRPEEIEKCEKTLEDCFSLAKALMDYGIDPQGKDFAGKTPSDYASEEGLAKLSVLFKGEYDENDPSINDKIAAGGQTFFQAVEKGDLKAAEALIRLGTDVNEVSTERDFEGFTPLAAACAYMNPDIVSALLNAGADPNFRSGENSRAALYYMMKKGKYSDAVFEDKIAAKIIRAMANKGLDINAPIDEDENTPLILACSERRETGYNYGTVKQIVRDILLEEYSPQLNAANKNGVTALMNLVMEDTDNIENTLIFLLENGADMSLKDKNGNTALMYAAKNRNKAAAKSAADLMFSFGDPLPKAVNNEGKTAMDFALEKENEDLVKYLMERM